jgi:hypothetical protein
MHLEIGGQIISKRGDFTVYANDGSIAFDGMIERDTETGAIPLQVLRNGQLREDPERKQQAVGCFLGPLDTERHGT